MLAQTGLLTMVGLQVVLHVLPRTTPVVVEPTVTQTREVVQVALELLSFATLQKLQSAPSRSRKQPKLVVV
jgi:hypothetical protein